MKNYLIPKEVRVHRRLIRKQKQLATKAQESTIGTPAIKSKHVRHVNGDSYLVIKVHISLLSLEVLRTPEVGFQLAATDSVAQLDIHHLGGDVNLLDNGGLRCGTSLRELVFYNNQYQNPVDSVLFRIRKKSDCSNGATSTPLNIKLEQLPGTGELGLNADIDGNVACHYLYC